MWFLAGYLLVAVAFYGYISSTATEDPSMGIDERSGITYTQSTEELRKAA
jgi:hypothetical protein